MNTIFRKVSVKERMPDTDINVVCWSVKFGDEKRSGSSHWAILSWDGEKWRDDLNRDYENNPDYHSITHWLEEVELPTDKDIDNKFLTKGLFITKDGQFSEPATMEMYYNYLKKEGAKWMKDFVLAVTPNEVQK